jgi:peroxiredoxin/outer membrane lipoprotein-sorting protein
MSRQLIRYSLVYFVFCSAASLPGQNASFDFRKVIQDVAAKCESATEYAFEGDMEVAGQSGSQPGKLLAKARVTYAVAASGKYFLRVEGVNKDEYVLVSDGQKSWAYVPKLKQYTAEESATVVGDDEDEEDSSGSGSDQEHDLTETFVHLVIPTLAGMAKTAAIADTNGFGDVKFEGKKEKWPVVRVVSREDKQQGRNRVDLTVDPATLNIGRMLWANSRVSNHQKVLIQMTMNFTSFQIGGKVPDSTFVFEPPKKAKLVDTVPIPGQTGSFLVNHPAPDFELKTLDGERIHLSELRGHPVLLSFWATWCGPCRRELPELAKIHTAFKDRGLLVFGVNDEGKGTARGYVNKAELPFDTLDDSGMKVSRMYRVHSIPSVFLIDGDGKVVRFFKGAHDEAALREALKSVGL